MSAPFFAWVFREGLLAGEPGVPFFVAAVIVSVAALVGSAAFNMAPDDAQQKTSSLRKAGIELQALSQSDDLSDGGEVHNRIYEDASHTEEEGPGRHDQHADFDTVLQGTCQEAEGNEGDGEGGGEGGHGVSVGAEEVTTLVGRVRGASMQSRVAALSFS